MQNNKPHLNVVVIGKEQSGKSTSIGHLLFELGEIKKDAFEQYYQNNIRQEKYSWVMAQLLEEKYLEETIISNYKKFESYKYLYTIIDTPGRKKYLKQLITGISLADVGLVFVTSVNGIRGFERGIQDKEIREHLLLAYSLGLRQLICCVNKMDENSVAYSQDRYNQIVDIMKDQFKIVGYNPEKINFIPISGLLGYNLIEKSLNLSWYKGPTLFEALNLIHPPKRSIHKPLRISILKILKKKQIDTLVLGKVVSGVLIPGMMVKCCPSQATFKVESMEMHFQQLNQAIPGDNISIRFNEQIYKFIDEGYICSDENYEPAKMCKSFEALITIILNPKQIKIGYSLILHYHSAHVPCQFQNLISKIDKDTNKIIEQNPTFLKTGDTALVKLVPKYQICLETHTEFPRLSKFVMYEEHKLIAVGIIKTVDK